MQQTTCDCENAADDTEQKPWMQKTCSGQRAADDMQSTACNGHRAADKPPTDRSVEAQPIATPCVREAVRHAEWTSCFFLAAAACAIPTLRAARACIPAPRPSWRRAADNRQRGDPSCSMQPTGHANRIARGGAERSCAAWHIGASENKPNTCDAREQRQREAGNVR
jgi:hypothetical protein